MTFKNLNTVFFKLDSIKIILSDFDGVFTSGRLGESFNERDTMGFNLLRYGFYLKNKFLPITAIVTGQKNRQAINLAKREHLDYIFLKVLDKKLIFNFFKKNFITRQIMVLGDDIIDISLFEKAGFRVLIKQPGSKIFYEWLKKQKFYDYLSKKYGGRGAIREASEIILKKLGIFNKVITSRIVFDKNYQKYWKKRNKIKTKIYVCDKGKLKYKKGFTNV